MKGFFIAILLSVVFISCNKSKRNELSLLLNSEVKYPHQLLAIKDSLQYCINGFSAPVKLVIYYGPTSCTLCKIAHLSDYKCIFDLSQNSQFQFRVIPIFAPSATNEDEMIHLLSSCQTPDTIYVDRHGDFMKLNPLLEQCIYNFFLVDRDNQVILIGDPLRGDSMWALFRSTLDNMLAHNGEYVPE